MNTTTYFILGMVLGSGITIIAFRVAINTFKMGINFITEPVESIQEDNLDEPQSDSYNYDTYTDYIKELEDEEEQELPN